MKNVLPLEQIQVEFGENCITRHLRWLLRHLGYPHPYGVIAREWGFYYDSYKCTDLYSIRAFNGDRWVGLRRFHMKVEEIRTTNNDEAWSLAKQSIDDGIPVLAWVDSYYLPYRSVSEPGIRHTVLLYGYQDDSVCWLMDGVYYTGPVPLVDLMAARDSREVIRQNPHRPNMTERIPANLNRHLLIQRPESNRSPREGIAEYMRRAVDKARPDPANPDSRGPRAIRRFADDFERLTDLNWSELRPLLRELKYRFEEVVQERKLGFHLLMATRDIAATPQADWSYLIRDAQRIHRGWLISRNLCLKSVSAERKHLLNDVKDRLFEVADMEEQLMDRFSAIDL